MSKLFYLLSIAFMLSSCTVSFNKGQDQEPAVNEAASSGEEAEDKIVIDCDYLNEIYAAIKAGTADEEFDVNKDGFVNAKDIEVLIAQDLSLKDCRLGSGGVTEPTGSVAVPLGKESN